MKKIVRFTASWCGPCKMLAKTLEEVESKLPIEVVDIDNPIVNEIYYKNELSIAFVSSVKTSDDGSGDILYLLKGVIPKPPESNPSVLEKDIITINQDSLGFLGSFICKKYRDDNN